MKLAELHEQYIPRDGSYTRYLEDEGFKVPEIKHGSGYLLVVYTPNHSTKKFKSLTDAEDAAPKGREHWQVYDLESQKSVDEPEWWWSQEMHGTLATRNAVGGD